MASFVHYHLLMAGKYEKLSEAFREVLSIANSAAPITVEELHDLFQCLQFSTHRANRLILKRNDIDPGELFLLDGIIRTFITDMDGRDITINLHTGPCIFTPSIAREHKSRSRVDCESLSGVRIARFPSDVLIKCMMENTTVQQWGDAVLRNELVKRADREWSFAALTGIERLVQFRVVNPGLENKIPHHYIASYLGITPVTLSRLRSKLGQ